MLIPRDGIMNKIFAEFLKFAFAFAARFLKCV